MTPLNGAKKFYCKIYDMLLLYVIKFCKALKCILHSDSVAVNPKIANHILLSYRPVFATIVRCSSLTR